MKREEEHNNVAIKDRVKVVYLIKRGDSSSPFVVGLKGVGHYEALLTQMTIVKDLLVFHVDSIMQMGLCKLLGKHLIVISSFKVTITPVIN